MGHWLDPAGSYVDMFLCSGSTFGLPIGTSSWPWWEQNMVLDGTLVWSTRALLIFLCLSLRQLAVLLFLFLWFSCEGISDKQKTVFTSSLPHPSCLHSNWSKLCANIASASPSWPCLPICDLFWAETLMVLKTQMTQQGLWMVWNLNSHSSFISP